MEIYLNFCRNYGKLMELEYNGNLMKDNKNWKKN